MLGLKSVHFNKRDPREGTQLTWKPKAARLWSTMFVSLKLLSDAAEMPAKFQGDRTTRKPYLATWRFRLGFFLFMTVKSKWKKSYEYKINPMLIWSPRIPVTHLFCELKSQYREPFYWFKLVYVSVGWMIMALRHSVCMAFWPSI